MKMETRAGNSILDFETLFSDLQELLNRSGLRPLPFNHSGNRDLFFRKNNFGIDASI